VSCRKGLEDALRGHSKPEVFNSDQGEPFTSHAFRGMLHTRKAISGEEFAIGVVQTSNAAARPSAPLKW
jgi:hypothetical protein